MHDDLISHLLLHMNAGIAVEAERIAENEMKNWIGIMFAMTLSPIANINEDWTEEDDGFIPTHSISIKSELSKGRFKFIHNHFATGAVGGGGKTFDGFRPIQTFLTDRVVDCFYPGQRGLLCADRFKLTARADRFPSSQCAETPSLYIREQVMSGSLFRHGMSPAGRTGTSPKNCCW
jgi:hypothetical protein